MISKLLSATVVGLDAQIVHVELHFSRGRSKFFMVGLPDKACSESKERVSAVVRNFLGKRLPAGPFTVNLAPADILKSGPIYDLPITLGILQMIGEVEFDPRNKLFIGELSLDGKTRRTKGILPIADLARKKGIKEVYIPETNVKEALAIPDLSIFPIKDITQLIKHFIGTERIESQKSGIKNLEEYNVIDTAYDMSQVRGQEHAKRALEIAAAGGHNVLMSGSPGSGKTLLAKTFPSILPGITLDESLEITRIYSVAGMLNGESLIQTRPFRKPHHTISHVALVGGGTNPHPGEITLAHRGVLFLDEFTEFSSKTLEALRQPLEDGIITISRAKGTLTFPANVILIAAMNPCRCGWLGDEKQECTCTPSEINRYKKRLSGPILDRIDLQVSVKRVEYDQLKSKITGQLSQNIKSKVQKARNIQKERFKDIPVCSNSEMRNKEIVKYVNLSRKSNSLLKNAMEVINLSARSYFRILKLSRTIADLEGKGSVSSEHVAEALSFRME